jgi:glucose/arabinose dehydrogenase
LTFARVARFERKRPSLKVGARWLLRGRPWRMLALAPPPQFAVPVAVAHVLTSDGQPPAMAVDESGRTLVARTDRRRVMVRRGAAGTARTVSRRRYASQPSVALTADSSAAVLWLGTAHTDGG